MAIDEALMSFIALFDAPDARPSDASDTVVCVRKHKRFRHSTGQTAEHHGTGPIVTFSAMQHAINWQAPKHYAFASGRRHHGAEPFRTLRAV